MFCLIIKKYAKEKSIHKLTYKLHFNDEAKLKGSFYEFLFLA